MNLRYEAQQVTGTDRWYVIDQHEERLEYGPVSELDALRRAQVLNIEELESIRLPEIDA